MSYDDDVYRNGPLLWPRPAKRPPIPDAPKPPPPRVTITTEAQAAEFWKRLDEKSRLLLAKGAPMIMGPWVEQRSDESSWWTRTRTGEVAWFCIIEDWTGCEQKAGQPFEFRSRGGTVEFSASLAAAKAACDAKLRELGFVLEGE